MESYLVKELFDDISIPILIGRAAILKVYEDVRKNPAKYVEQAKQHLLQGNKPYGEYAPADLDLLSKTLVQYLVTELRAKIKEAK